MHAAIQAPTTDFNWTATKWSPILAAEERINAAQTIFTQKVNTLISSNYRDFSESDSKILTEIFDEVQALMRERNLQIVAILNESSGIDIKKKFDFTWGLRIPKSVIEGWQDREIQDFFSPSNWFVREEWEYLARWYQYYFNFLKTPFKPSWFKISDWIEELAKYCETTKKLLQKFDGREIQSLSQDEQLVLAWLLEHRKNTLFQLKNILSFLSDKDFFARQVAGADITPGSHIHWFLPKEYLNIDFMKEITRIDEELTRLTFYYGDTILQVKNNYVLDFQEQYSAEDALWKVKDYMSEIETSMSVLPEKKENETDEKYEMRTGYSQTYKTKRYRRLMSKIIRPIREEDNFLNQALTSFLVASNIPEENQKLRIYWMLYGGIEIPFVAKYIFNRFFGKKAEKMNVEHLLASSYANRTIKNISAGSNYIWYPQSTDAAPELQVVLDDNVWKWNTLNTIGNILSQGGPIISWASQVWLRRRLFNGLFDGNNMIAFLSKIPTASSVLPILKAWDKYKHGSSSYKSMIPYYLRNPKRLPNFKGKT